jgi:lauroyl/myristoyl acyltransferase
MSSWKRFRYRLEELGCRLLAAGIPRLPRAALLRLARALGALAFRFDARGRAVARENLACVFGGQLSARQRDTIARASYANFARTMLDLFWAARLGADDWSRWMRAEGFAEIRQRLEREGRGAVFLCVHQGNWEWASLAAGFLGFRNIVVAETFKNPRLTEIFRAHRQHSGQTLIDQDGSLLKMLRHVKRGGCTGMLIDLNLRPEQAATVIEAFAGLKMCVPLLHAALAQRAGALLVPVETQPQADGTVRITAHPPLEVPVGAGLAQIAQRCWDAFDPILLARPEEYLWPYKHFRYRPRGAQRVYPSYANESGKFERLLRQTAAEAIGPSQ